MVNEQDNSNMNAAPTLNEGSFLSNQVPTFKPENTVVTFYDAYKKIKILNEVKKSTKKQC